MKRGWVVLAALALAAGVACTSAGSDTATPTGPTSPPPTSEPATSAPPATSEPKATTSTTSTPRDGEVLWTWAAQLSGVSDHQTFVVDDLVIVVGHDSSQRTVVKAFDKRSGARKGEVTISGVDEGDGSPLPPTIAIGEKGLVAAGSADVVPASGINPASVSFKLTLYDLAAGGKQLWQTDPLFGQPPPARTATISNAMRTKRFQPAVITGTSVIGAMSDVPVLGACENCAADGPLMAVSTTNGTPLWTIDELEPLEVAANGNVLAVRGEMSSGSPQPPNPDRSPTFEAMVDATSGAVIGKDSYEGTHTSGVWWVNPTTAVFARGSSSHDFAVDARDTSFTKSFSAPGAGVQCSAATSTCMYSTSNDYDAEFIVHDFTSGMDTMHLDAATQHATKFSAQAYHAGAIWGRSAAGPGDLAAQVDVVIDPKTGQQLSVGTNSTTDPVAVEWDGGVAISSYGVHQSSKPPWGAHVSKSAKSTNSDPGTWTLLYA